MLFESFENTDYTGSRICALKKQPDVQNLRFVSKTIRNITGLCWELVAWFLVAQRMFDAITNDEVLAPAASKRSSFTHANLFALRKKYAKVNLKSREPASSAAELQKCQSNSSGFAGAYSRHTFLNKLCDDADFSQAFVSWCQSPDSQLLNPL